MSLSIRFTIEVTRGVNFLMQRSLSRNIVPISVFASKLFKSLFTCANSSILFWCSELTVTNSSLTDCNSSFDVSSSSLVLWSSSFDDCNSSLVDFSSSLVASSSSIVNWRRARVVFNSLSSALTSGWLSSLIFSASKSVADWVEISLNITNDNPFASSGCRTGITDRSIIW